MIKISYFRRVEADNLIFGTRAVIEALEAGKEIEKILLQKGLSNELYHQLRKALRDQNIPLQFVPPEKLKRITTGNHQGVVAFISAISENAEIQVVSIVKRMDHVYI